MSFRFSLTLEVTTHSMNVVFHHLSMWYSVRWQLTISAEPLEINMTMSHCLLDSMSCQLSSPTPASLEQVLMPTRSSIMGTSRPIAQRDISKWKAQATSLPFRNRQQYITAPLLETRACRTFKCRLRLLMSIRRGQPVLAL